MNRSQSKIVTGRLRDGPTEGFVMKYRFSCVSMIFFVLFLVACYATLHSAMSVRWLVGWLVSQSPFYFVGVFELFERTAPAQMPW